MHKYYMKEQPLRALAQNMIFCQRILGKNIIFGILVHTYISWDRQPYWWLVASICVRHAVYDEGDALLS